MSENRGPQVSPDGNWWWDGQRWQPMPGKEAPVHVHGTVTTRAASWRWIFWTILIGGIGLLLAWAALSSAK